MGNFFDTIISFFETIWNVISNIFLSLISLLQAVSQSTAVPLQVALLVFAPLSASVLAVLAISVLKLIIGRDNS